MAVAKDGTPPDTLRQWLRTRGNPEVQQLASNRRRFKELVKHSRGYVARYSPEGVRESTASHVVSALTRGLRGAEAALLALVGIDMMESGKDGTLLTGAFAVTMGSTQQTITNRARKLASIDLLTIASVSDGATTRVRMCKSEPAIVTDEMTALIADLAAGTDSALTELFFAVRSPVFGRTGLNYDAWYLTLLDALRIRDEVIGSAGRSRVSRTRSRMRGLAGTDDLLDLIREMETPELLEEAAEAEVERKVNAALRTGDIRVARARRDAGWDFVERIAPLPRRSAHDEDAPVTDTHRTRKPSKTRTYRQFLKDAKVIADTLEAGERKYACDALATRLVGRDWDDDRIAETLHAVFPDHMILRWVVAHGAVPAGRSSLVEWVAKALPASDLLPVELREHFSKTMHLDEVNIAKVVTDAVRIKRVGRFVDDLGEVPSDRTEVVAWFREAQKTYRPSEVVALRNEFERVGLSRVIARREFPDARLAAFYAARGDVPAGTDTDEIKRWVRADSALAPVAAIGSLRDDLEIAGWSENFIVSALPRLTKGGTDNV